MRSIAIVAIAASLVLGLAGPGDANDAPGPTFDILTLHVGQMGRGAPVAPAPGVSTNAIGEVVSVASEAGGDALLLRDVFGFMHRLLAVGDPLAGGAVRRIVVMPNSLDEYRRIIFYAELADGRAGLFRFEPVPRPAQVIPTSGYRDGSITFTLQGTGFTPNVEVRFGEIKTGVTVLSATTMTGVIRRSDRVPLGPVDVSVRRPGGKPWILSNAFEFRDRPASGCRGFWPDHRPPVMTTSSLLAGWPSTGVPIAVYLLYRRFRRRRSRRAADDR